MAKSLFECVKDHAPFDVYTEVDIGNGRKVLIDAVSRKGTEHSHIQVTIALASPNDNPLTEKEWQKIENRVRDVVFNGE